MELAWPHIVSFLAVFTLAIVSPGPNFVLVLNTALAGSRRAGLYTALGVATGSGLFGLAGLLGLLLVIHALPHFAMLIRLLGGGYLCWLGLGMAGAVLRSSPAGSAEATHRPAGNASAAWRTGLLTNLTNPKAWAFYFALFTVVIHPGFLPWQKVFLNLSMFVISFAWYAAVALLISSERFRPRFARVQPAVQLVLGILLIALGGWSFWPLVAGSG